MRMRMHLGRGKGPREAGKSDGAGALRSLCCWKLSYPGRVLECAGSSAGAARREKWSQGVTTCILFLPSLPCSFPSSSFFSPPPSISSSSSILPSSLPSRKGAQFSPQTLTRTPSSSSLHPSVDRHRGGGVLPARWLGEKMGSSRPGRGSQRERGG